VVNKGELDGVRIMREETYAKMHDNFVTKRDSAIGMMYSELSQGGVALYR
jgi:hypothetical protein